MRYVHCLLLLFILIGSGCKTDRLKETSIPSSEKPRNSEAWIEGRVGPFWVENAHVSLYQITEEGVDFNSAVSNVLTSHSGEFRLAWDDRYNDHPMLLRVQVDQQGARLKCILPAGCNGVSFGESYSPDASFEIFLAISELRADVFYNVTPLSHLAFKLIEESVLSPITSVNSEGRANRSFLIAQSNSRVANRFGIVGELASTPFANLTSDDEMQTASEASIKASVLTAGMIQAASKLYGQSNIEAAFQNFSSQFLTLGLPGVSGATSVVDHAAVLREASSIVSGIQSLYERDVGGLISALEALSFHVAMEETGLYSHGTPSETLRLAPVDKAKSLVADVRQVSASIDLQKIIALSSFSALVDGGANEALSQLGFNLKALEVFNDNQFDHVFEAVGLTLEAGFSALVDYYGKSIISTHYEGLHFTHTVEQGAHTFVFQADYDLCEGLERGCSVIYDLKVTFRVVSFTGNATTFAPGVLDYHIVGSVASEDLRLSFHDSGQQMRFIRPIISIPEHEYGENTNLYWLAADALRIRLPFELIKETGSGNESLKGLIALDSEKFDLKYKSSDERILEADGSVSALSVDEINIERLEGLKINFSSAVKPIDGNEFRGSINISQSSRSVVEPIVIKNNTLEHCDSIQALECDEIHAEIFIEGETPENFLGMYASIGVESVLKGMLTPAFVELSAARSSPDTNSVNSLKLSYPGHAVTMSGRFSSNGIIALEALNLDGTHLHFDTIQGRRRGEVKSSGGGAAAEVVDMGQWIKILYANGDFESL